MTLETRAREAGFSLIEMMIATFLMVIAMLVASQVLAESVTLLARMAHEQQNVQPAFALQLLSADLENAAGNPRILESGRLGIPKQDTSVYYKHDEEEGCLEREVKDAEGKSLGRRCILFQVQSFEFLSLGPGLARVQLAVEGYETETGLPALDLLFQRPDQVRTRSFSTTVALRGTLRGARW